MFWGSGLDFGFGGVPRPYPKEFREGAEPAVPR